MFDLIWVSVSKSGTAPNYNEVRETSAHTSGAPSLSIGQECVLRFQRAASKIPVYNIGLCVEVHGDVDQVALVQSLRSVVARHEAFRSAIYDDCGHAALRILSFAEAHEYLLQSFSGCREMTLEAAWQQATALAKTPFDFDGRKPLFRCALSRTGVERYILTIVVHHSAFDGWSTSVMLGDLHAQYLSWQNIGLHIDQPLPIQPSDLAAQARRRLEDGVKTQRIAYWKEVLRDFCLPRSHAGDAIQESRFYRGAQLAITVPAATIQQL